MILLLMKSWLTAVNMKVLLKDRYNVYKWGSDYR